MKDARVSMALENTIVDMKDYKEPIKYIIDDGLYWELVPGIRKKTDVYIRQNEAEFEDNYIQIGFPDEREFYQVAMNTHSFESESGGGDILSIYFRYDKNSDIYNRQIYSLGELMGEAGGFYGALLAIGSIFIFIFSERLFVSSVLKQIYQIDNWQESEMTKSLRERKQMEPPKYVIDCIK